MIDDKNKKSDEREIETGNSGTKRESSYKDDKSTPTGNVGTFTEQSSEKNEEL